MYHISIQKLYQNKLRGNDTKTCQIFGVPIGSTKILSHVKFHPAALVTKYHQNTYNNFCLSSLALAFHFIGENSSVTALFNSIEESLTLQREKFKNIIQFANYIMKSRRKLKPQI